ncbi:cysteine desulfurase family protein [Paenibacillus hodogayensis]|uniref:Cysteine desulfurase family protein n=1 Tax=Paenibacillus hodogayensis TaxID=279208 RepID=A0ABV5VQH1_9BACL
MYYFDHAATTPPYEEVVQTVAEVMGSHFGNPSSIHGLGLQAERLVGKAREAVARLLHVLPEEIVFTSGGTESNNMAIVGAALHYAGRGKHLVTSELEHPSVYECFRYLERIGYEVTYVKPNGSGQLSAREVLAAVRQDTILVSVMHVNNEIGAIQPVAEIGEGLREFPRTLFHVDAVQSVGKLPVKPGEWGVDLLSVSGHKFRGPRGSGLLYKRKGIALQPLLIGGGQEAGARSGTENVPAMVGMAKALRLTMERRESDAQRMAGLRERLLTHIKAIPGLVYNGSDREADMAPHIIGFSAPGIKPEVVVHALEEHHIYISTKSACSSGIDRPSRILLALGADGERAASGLRISLSPEHDTSSVDVVGRTLGQIMEKLGRFR